MSEKKKACVVSLGISKGYLGDSHKKACKKPLFEKGIQRLRESVEKLGYDFIGWDGEWPKDCPTMYDCPYGFKSYCISEAWKQGYRYVIWADSSLILKEGFLKECFTFIKEDGYYFLGVERRIAYCSDYTANKLGFTHAQVSKMKHRLIGGFFGLDRENQKASIFFNELQRLVKEKFVIRGTDKEPYNFLNSYIGHRHDQTVMYLLVRKFGLKIHLSSLNIKVDHCFVKPEGQ